MLEVVHTTLWWVVLGLAAATLLVGLLGLAQNRFVKVPTDRLILATVATLTVTTLVGPMLLLTGHRPQDVLHYVYAAAAWLALPAGRYVARSGSPRRRAGAIAVASVVLLGVLVRLLMTGPGA